MSEYTDKVMKIFLNGKEHNNDYCIICNHDVRKDDKYFDLNGATVCECCMHTKATIKNKI